MQKRVPCTDFIELLTIVCPSPSSPKAEQSINSRLQLVMKSGKSVLGYKQNIRTLRNGKSKLIIIANNCPALRDYPSFLCVLTFLCLSLHHS